MSRYSVTVVRADGRQMPITPASDDFTEVCRQVLDKAQGFAIDGSPLGDRQPPRCIRVTDGDGRLLFRIAIDPSLIPTAH